METLHSPESLKENPAGWIHWAPWEREEEFCWGLGLDLGLEVLEDKDSALHWARYSLLMSGARKKVQELKFMVCMQDPEVQTQHLMSS